MAFDTQAERQVALSGGVQMGMIPWTLAAAFVNGEAALALGAFPFGAGASNPEGDDPWLTRGDWTGRRAWATRGTWASRTDWVQG